MHPREASACGSYLDAGHRLKFPRTQSASHGTTSHTIASIPLPLAYCRAIVQARRHPRVCCFYMMSSCGNRGKVQGARRIQHTLRRTRPYEKGLMPSLDSRVASDPPTFSPALIRCTSDTISTVPLLILVGMFRACTGEHNQNQRMQPEARPTAAVCTQET